MRMIAMRVIAVAAVRFMVSPVRFMVPPVRPPPMGMLRMPNHPSVDGRRHSVDSLPKSRDETFESAALGRLSIPCVSLGERLLLEGDDALQFRNVSLHELQFRDLGLQVNRCEVIRGGGSISVDKDTFGGDGSIDVGDPDGGDLTEPKRKTNILDSDAVHRFDGEAHQLFTGEVIIAFEAVKLPTGLHGGPFFCR